jgi:hypothetical protein
MPDEPEVVVFEFNFKGVAQWKQGQAPVDREKRVQAEQDLIEHLSTQEGTIVEALKTELAQVLQPFTSGHVIVLAEVKFFYSSVGIDVFVVGVLTNTIAQALGPPLWQLIERTLGRVFRQTHGETFGPDNQQFEPFTGRITNQQISRRLTTHTAPPPGLQEMNVSQSREIDTPGLQISQQTNPPPRPEETSGTQQTSSTEWLIRAIGVGTTVIMVLLAVLLTMVILQAG